MAAQVPDWSDWYTAEEIKKAIQARRVRTSYGVRVERLQGMYRFRNRTAEDDRK